MQIFGIKNSGVQRDSAYVPSSAQQTSQNATSFQSFFSSASDNSNNAVQEFLDYANESPAQRLFTDWLGSQHITQQQFNAMSPQDQLKLTEKFQEQMKERLGNGSTESSATPSSGVSVQS